MSGFFDWVYTASPWIIFPASVAAWLVGAFLALSLVYTVTDRREGGRHGELASFIVTNIAVIYAVLLAFIAVATWESYTKASDLVETEANYAGNLYRDSGGLPEPIKANVRAQVQAYLRFVIDKEWPAQQTGHRVQGGWRALENIHQAVTRMEPATQGQTVMMQEMLRGLNDIYNARTSRLDALEGHIPDLVWGVIVALGILTIGYACFVQSDGFLIHLFMLAGLAASIALVIALIVELDYPFRGRISVGADAYERVLRGVPMIQ